MDVSFTVTFSIPNCVCLKAHLTYSFNHNSFRINKMVDCHEFVFITHYGVYSTFVDRESLKKFEEGPLPQTMPLVPGKPVTRYKREAAYVLEDRRFDSYESFEKFFKEDIEDTLDLIAARLLIEAVLHELNPIYTNIFLTDAIPQGVAVVSRATRIETIVDRPCWKDFRYRQVAI